MEAGHLFRGHHAGDLRHGDMDAAAAGIAIFPLCAVMKENAGFTVNSFMSGTVTETTPGGQPVILQTANREPHYRMVLASAEYGENVRFYVNRKDSDKPLLLTDFASCGKRWLSKHNRMTVWMNVEKG